MTAPVALLALPEALAEEVAAYRTSPKTLIRVIAEGPWSARDIELLYEHIGLSLRNNDFDVTTKAEPA